MKDSIFQQSAIQSPAFVYDQQAIRQILEILQGLKQATGCQPLYSIKAINLSGVMQLIQPGVFGFSCSSLFEIQLAREILDAQQSVHVTSPGYRDNEWNSIIELSDYVTLNSIGQWRRHAEKISRQASCGIRINPELSFVNDARFDPCRPASKLGMTFAQLANAGNANALNWKPIEGVHIHNNCGSTDFDELKQSVEYTMENLRCYQTNLNWINLGGGYLFNESADLTPLTTTVNWLRENFGLSVFIEPGKAVTGHAAYLVATVIDLIETENRTLAVLDTSINHLPEVFEYQYQPKVMGAVSHSEHAYRLVGCSCLSGDLFGDYYFTTSLELGSRVVFENIGAYMQVKANMFNGINLPATYLLDTDRQFRLIKQYDYASFRSRL